MTTQDSAVAQLREWALCLAERGWSVFPVRPGGKIPALHGRKGCAGTGICANGHQGWEQRATTDPDRITRCWTGQRPWNIGIACLPSDLLVVDCDMPGHGGGGLHVWDRALGTSGDEALHALAERAGEALPDTYSVRTPSSGMHYYFRLPEGYRNTAKDLHPLIDTRAAGGLVVAAGSITPIGAYELIDDSEPAVLPGWLLQALAPKSSVAESAPVEIAPARLSRYGAAALRNECGHLAAARPGRQNQTLYEAAFALGRLVAGGVLDDATVRAALHRAMSRLALSRPNEPWTAQQINDTIDSALWGSSSKPRRPGIARGEAA